MNSDQIRQLMEKLGISLECPRCGRKYEAGAISLRGYRGTTYQLSLICTYCHTPVSATIGISGDLQNIAENFNASFNQNNNPRVKPLDIARTRKTKISSDDVIDIHNFLKNFDGDFEKILKG